MEDLGKVLYEKSGNIVIVTMNRPEKLNAKDIEMRKGLDLAIQKFQEDEDAKAMIITGAGDKSFCVGGDVSGFDITMMTGRELTRISASFYNALEKLKKTVIAAVNGYALGGGLEIALACDIIIASEKASFGSPDATVGMMDFFGVLRLPQRVGVNKAKELMMTGDRISAEEALRIGLVNKVVPHEKLMEAAIEMANKIAEKAPLSIEFVKSIINREFTTSEFSSVIDATTVLFASGDSKEGVKAFKEKRKPKFQGK
jgi:enoyl-CoA hydratase